MGNKSAIFRYAVQHAAVLILLSLSCAAQVLPLGKVSDPAARVLQQQYISQLQQLSSAASTLHFPYPFYFSQTLDVDEAKQKLLPRGSIHFDNFNGQIRDRPLRAIITFPIPADMVTQQPARPQDVSGCGPADLLKVRLATGLIATCLLTVTLLRLLTTCAARC